jgi:AraC-like DNA-binding protein
MARRDRGNRTKYWCSTHVPGMSLLHADFTTHDYAPHTHEAFVIAITECGGAEIASGRSIERVCPSILFVSNPEERQSARMGGSRRWLYRSFYVTRPATTFIADRLGIKDAPYFTRSMFEDVDLIGRFGHLHRVLEAENDALGADEAVTDAFGALFSRYGHDGSRPERAPGDRAHADRIIELMNARYEENLGLDELASVAGLTSFQLIGLFKRTVGLTPHAYLIHIRLNAACRHLKREYTLAESALAAGFCDQSALTRHFRRCYGITPRQFAEAARASQARLPPFPALT